ncbi:MAG TPA: YafY family protein [Pseudonocardia sp.]|jgi:predicted DNA-binding transcriptional regulator YafY|uniref:helix-turn-helix transcriptional regulator n=1 Tax=Pseudonocardia sp. TaxID=60912 RepID=UPI002ED9D176
MSAARVLALLELLQARPGLTGPELAARLGIHPRTVRRHLATLDSLGVPVVADRGRHGGYRLLPGYRLPPLMLTGDEAVAVVLGLLAAERTGLHAAAPAVSSAQAKIDRVLPAELRERTRAVAETLGFSASMRSPGRSSEEPSVAAPRADVLLSLGEATRDHRRVRLEYTSWSGAPSERELDPFGLVFHAGRWYVTGHDHLRDGVRTFRLDRVASVRQVGAGSPPPVGFDPVGTVVAGIGEVRWATPVKVVLHAPLNDVRARLPRSAGTLEAHPDGTLLRGRAERLDGLASMLAGLGWRFSVHSPDELRAAVRALAQRLAEDAAAV